MIHRHICFFPCLLHSHLSEIGFTSVSVWFSEIFWAIKFSFVFLCSLMVDKLYFGFSVINPIVYILLFDCFQGGLLHFHWLFKWSIFPFAFFYCFTRWDHLSICFLWFYFFHKVVLFILLALSVIIYRTVLVFLVLKKF